jgi:hypothetical protein
MPRLCNGELFSKKSGNILSSLQLDQHTAKIENNVFDRH